MVYSRERQNFHGNSSFFQSVPGDSSLIILSFAYLWIHTQDTGWTNVNLLCFPDTVEIASLERLRRW